MLEDDRAVSGYVFRQLDAIGACHNSFVSLALRCSNGNERKSSPSNSNRSKA